METIKIKAKYQLTVGLGLDTIIREIAALRGNVPISEVAYDYLLIGLRTAAKEELDLLRGAVANQQAFIGHNIKSSAVEKDFTQTIGRSSAYKNANDERPLVVNDIALEAVAEKIIQQERLQNKKPA